MKSWREEELERLKKEYKSIKIGSLRSKSLKLIIDYHERMLGIKFWDDDMLEIIHEYNNRRTQRKN